MSYTVHVFHIHVLYMYTDDEPKDGPSAFILLKGFNDAEVLPHLGKIGVTVNALVKISQEGGEEEDTGVDGENSNV